MTLDVQSLEMEQNDGDKLISLVVDFLSFYELHV